MLAGRGCLAIEPQRTEGMLNIGILAAFAEQSNNVSGARQDHIIGVSELWSFSPQHTNHKIDSIPIICVVYSDAEGAAFPGVTHVGTTRSLEGRHLRPHRAATVAQDQPKWQRKRIRPNTWARAMEVDLCQNHRPHINVAAIQAHDERAFFPETELNAR